jgi:hypothetical protein
VVASIVLLLTLAGFAVSSVASAHAAAFECEPVQAANEIPAPPPIWKLSGRPPSAAEVAYEAKISPLCASGYVPVPTPNGPAAPLQTPNESLRTGQLSLSLGTLSSTERRAAVPPAYNGEKCQLGGCYWHVADQVLKSAVGMEYATTVAEPHVSTYVYAHSIDQLGVSAGGTGHIKNTIEAGLDVDPGLFGSSKPHFFIYLNDNEYAGPPDCYDCDYHPYGEPKLAPGGEVPTGTTQIKIGVEFWGGDWWIWAGTQWIAYVEPGFWPGDDFTKGELEQNFGEVFDNESIPTSQMGNGQFGSSSAATPMTAPLIMLTEDQEETTSLAKELVTDSALYSLGAINGARTEWHFGGPGDPAPPTATTEAAQNTTQTESTLHGAVNPYGSSTEYYFQYGETSSYGQSTSEVPAGEGTTSVAASAGINRLEAGKTYHYRVVAHNSWGTSYGSDETLTTLGADIVSEEPEGNGACRYMVGMPESNGHEFGWYASNVKGVTCTKLTALGRTGSSGRNNIVSVESEGDGADRYVVGLPASNGHEFTWEATNLKGMTPPEAMAVGELTNSGRADIVSVEPEGDGACRYMVGIPASNGHEFSWEATNLKGMTCTKQIAIGRTRSPGQGNVVSVEPEGDGADRYVVGMPESDGHEFGWYATNLKGMTAAEAITVGGL